MSLLQWYVSRGRINRSTFWLHYVLPIVGLGLLALFADLAFGFTDTATLAATTSVGGAADLGLFSTVVSLLTIVPSISSNVTRLHDRGHSAWWLLLALIPLVGPILLLVQTGFLRGDAGPNRYGPPPGVPLPPAGDPLYPPPSWS